jgi:hypothetical protein
MTTCERRFVQARQWPRPALLDRRTSEGKADPDSRRDGAASEADGPGQPSDAVAHLLDDALDPGQARVDTLDSFFDAGEPALDVGQVTREVFCVQGFP